MGEVTSSVRCLGWRYVLHWSEMHTFSASGNRMDLCFENQRHCSIHPPLFGALPCTSVEVSSERHVLVLQQNHLWAHSIWNTSVSQTNTCPPKPCVPFPEFCLSSPGLLVLPLNALLHCPVFLTVSRLISTGAISFSTASSCLLSLSAPALLSMTNSTSLSLSCT